MVDSWIKETGLADLDRSSFCRGSVSIEEQSSSHRYLGEENYGRHFVHTLSTSTLGPKGRLYHFPLSLTPGVKHHHYSMGLRIHSGLHSLKVSSVPYRASCSSSSWL